MPKETRTILIQIALFLTTIYTTTIAGADLVNFKTVEILKKFEKGSWQYFTTGFYYSIPFLLFLTTHEFGHYFTARYHKIKSSLPYYIPFIGIIGTLGAVIRLKEPQQTKQHFFDVGIAGPLAGFVIGIGVLWYGFTHLPSYEEILKIHPEYENAIQTHGVNYADAAIQDLKAKDKGGMVLKVGDNLIFWLFSEYVAPNKQDVPNAYEVMHYPFLFAGYLALFFTALNLIPIGQLDGGHIVYGLFGKAKSDLISQWVFTVFVAWAGLGFLTPYMATNELIWRVLLYGGFMYLLFTSVFESKITALTYGLGVFAFQFSISAIFPEFEGYNGWLLYALLISKFLGTKHPQAYIEAPLDTKRKILGWIALLIFILCFSPRPFLLE